jgi:lysophospholipase L1-like esterase
MLPAYLADNVEVVNLAIPGATSKTFLASSNWPQAVAPGGGYLLIQFGHNDGKLGKHPGAVEADGAFSDNLRLMIDAARAAGMQSVLVTPMHRVKYESDGKLTTELDPSVNPMPTNSTRPPATACTSTQKAPIS